MNNLKRVSGREEGAFCSSCHCPVMPLAGGVGQEGTGQSECRAEQLLPVRGL